MGFVRNIASSCVFVLMLGAPALAQQTKAPAPPAAAPAPITAPDTTVSRFGDWTLRCSTSEAGKICEMVQTLQIQTQQGQSAPFANLAIGRSGKGQPLKFVAQLPNNVTIATGIVVEAKPDKPLAGSIHRCLPMGCFGDVVLADDVRKRWQTRSDAGVVKFHDGTNKLIDLPLSFRGFGAAMDAMMKEVP